MFELEAEEGAKRSDEVGKGSVLDVSSVLAQVVAGATGGGGGLVPEAEVLVALRRYETRDAELRRMVLGACPPGVNADFWLRWLAGGSHPYEPPRLRKAPTSSDTARTQHGTGKQLARSADRIVKQQRAVDAARASLEAEERRLETLNALESTVVQWAFSQHLAGIMAPMFAMGPAWVVMRVLSAYVPPAEMALETELTSDPKRVRAIEEQVRDERRVASERAMATLDLWAGEVDFEQALRSALMDVVDAWSGRGEEAERRGLRARSRERMRASVKPDTAMTAREILDGMPSL